jgi:dTDP-4-amino-4,6-dideoxygalactose transaminase
MLTRLNTLYNNKLELVMLLHYPLVRLAIHLALILLNVKPNDYVFCQSMTFSASANPILYQGAIPVFIDSEKETWNMDPDLLRGALKEANKKNKLPKAIIAVHLYGMPAKIDEIIEIADEYGIPVIEDAS